MPIDPVTGEIIASVAPTVLGKLFGGGGPSARALAAQANDFTREMMSTRHQWEVQDLKKAGLNPILSAHGAPSMGSSHMGEFVNPVDDMAKIATSARDAMRLKAEIDNIKQDTVLKAAQAGSAEAAANLAGIHSASALQSMDISRPKADIARVISQGTGKFSAVANSAAAAARQVPRFITHGLPGIVRRRVFSKH